MGRLGPFIYINFSFLLTTILYLCSIINAEKLVSSSLDANWAHTSLLAETSEFLANEDPTGKAFWLFLDELVGEGGNRQSQATKSHRDEFALALELAAPLLPADGGGALSLLRFALALRLYSPRVQLHRQQIGADRLALAGPECARTGPFFEVNGAIGCLIGEIDHLMADADQRSASPLFSVDHLCPMSSSVFSPPPIVAILYADMSRPDSFRSLHHHFLELNRDGRCRYVFRHFDGNLGSSPSSSSPAPLSPISLSGYGVELAIKSTEYKAIDDSQSKSGQQDAEEAPQDLHGFNFKLLRDKYVHLRKELHQFQMHLAELDELAPLKQWEIADIGLQAAQKIMESAPEEAVSTLVDVSQNFPIRARSLAQIRVRQSLRQEIGQNQQRWASELEMGEGESALWLNGIPVGPDMESLDPFQFFHILRQEQRLASAFAQLGYRREYLSVLHSMDLSEDKPGTWAIDYRDGKPEWLNNLDKDKQYSDWGNSVRLLLQPYFPGMIRPIARNLFSLVCVVDPAAPDFWSLLKIVFSLYAHQVPLRIGFVFAVNDSESANGKTDLGIALYNIYQFVKMEKSPPKAVHFLQRLHDELGGETVQLDDVHKFFKRHYSDQEVDEVFGPGTDYDSGRQDGLAFFRRSGLANLPALLLNGVPLDNSAVESADKIEEAILVAVMRQTGNLQRAVISGKLSDRENVQNWVMSQPDVLPRLNQRILASSAAQPKSSPSPPFHTAQECPDLLSANNSTSSEQMTQCIAAQMPYLVRSDENDPKRVHWLTIWLIADLDSLEGRLLLRNGLKALKKNNHMRLAVLHSAKAPSDPKSANKIRLSQLVDALLHRLPSTAAKQALNKLLGSEELMNGLLEKELDTISLDSIAGHGVNMDPVLSELKSSRVQQRLSRQFAFVTGQLGLSPAAGQRAVLANGILYGPLAEDEQFEPEDFGLVERLAERRGAKAVAELVIQWQKEGKPMFNGNPSETTFKMLSAVNNFAVRKKRQKVEFEIEFESVLNLLADEEGGPVLEITAIVDPLSRTAQKLAPILQTLLKVANADLRLALNPKQRLSELPLKRFFRFVLREEPAFSPGGQLVPNVAQFRELPQKQLLTLNLIVPDAWMVQPVWAEHDLDNIRVATAHKDIVARFQLRHILLEGHCFDDQTGNPPRGLQFILGTRAEPALYDTIVMANLGYFQLKAGPGAWTLRLREGRSKEIYEIKGSVDAEAESQEKGKIAAEEKGEGEAGEVEQLHVLVDSFSGKTIRMRVAKREGMEKRNLLTEEEKEGGDEGLLEEEEADEEGGHSIWSNLAAPKKIVSKLMGAGGKARGGEGEYNVINIFSLASGHLYERFMRIMMLSVLKNTKSPVKFWLLNNYLSPQFRESLPILARHYGFDYQLVEYKWPRWLHQQTEKQRIMWGYKILFLDVLFPLDVKKIIFVDADQIIRTDMMELMEHDLQGAPYGYTPFCSSRTSMDGFRFWKSGYWATHLAGRKYHISALYVVDLQKFRQIAAGDRLRGQYQGLSSDPNSLANLDQDLPNNMIHQVRIHSLPQEWLWCETWCDDASKAKAKTIDLCNNPQTKEPKLDSAIRIIPEWTQLDGEIKQVLASANATAAIETIEDVEEEKEGSEEKQKAEKGEAGHEEL